MPGRWAAPPAPATITSMPRASAPSANSAIHTGVRCAETTCFSYGTANRSSASTAWLIVSQSEVDPMITATRGRSDMLGVLASVALAPGACFRFFVLSYSFSFALSERIAPLPVERVEPFGLADVEAGAGDALLQRDRLGMRHRSSLRAHEPAVPEIGVDESRQLSRVDLHAAVGDRLQLQIPGELLERRAELSGRAARPIEEDVE